MRTTGRSTSSPTAIDPGTGAAAFGASRLHPQYGQVLSLNSNLQSDTRQVTASANGFTDRGILYSLAYTYSRVRDQSSFSGGSAVYGFASPTTAGNPNVQPFGTSDLQREHQFVGTFTYPVTPLVELTAIAQVNSGAPYSPIVNGDVNGDGVSRNDRAFVFDPGNPLTDPSVASAMRTLLDHGSRPHSGLSPVAARPGRLSQQLLRSLDGVAELAGEHPAERIGARPPPHDLRAVAEHTDRTRSAVPRPEPSRRAGDSPPHLIRHCSSITGFNPGTNEYKYVVNTHFGRASSYQAYGQPFLFVIGGRLNVGPGDAEQQLRGFLGGGGRGGGGGGPGAVATRHPPPPRIRSRASPTRSRSGSRRGYRIRSTRSWRSRTRWA